METIESTYNEVLEWDGISAENFEAITNLKNQTLNAMSALGEWKDCIAYPNYKISSTGAFMNKRTLKMLKHFVHVQGNGPVVTLYREGKGEVLSVKELLIDHFGAEAVVPIVNYFSHKLTELAPSLPYGSQTKGPKAKAKAKAKGKTQYFGPAIEITD